MEPKAGRHFTSHTPDRSAFEFVRFAREVAMQYPTAKTIHLVTDNLNTHNRKSLSDAPGEEVGGEIWDQFTDGCSTRLALEYLQINTPLGALPMGSRHRRIGSGCHQSLPEKSACGVTPTPHRFAMIIGEPDRRVLYIRLPVCLHAVPDSIPEQPGFASERIRTVPLRQA